MNTVLRIDASARHQGSVSRDLGDYFQSKWLTRFSEDRFIGRDLQEERIGQMEQDTIEGFYTPKEQMTDHLKKATALSDQLIGELQGADVILLTTPMYNFSVPASLKAWIDQVVRIGHTFSYDGHQFGGLVHSDRAYIISAFGAPGYQQGGALQEANFLEPYLKFLLNFLGVKEVHSIPLEGTTAGEAHVASQMTQVKAQIDQLIETA